MLSNGRDAPFMALATSPLPLMSSTLSNGKDAPSMALAIKLERLDTSLFMQNGRSCHTNLLVLYMGCFPILCNNLHAKRKTVLATDVVYALKRQGRTLYGFGGFCRLAGDIDVMISFVNIPYFSKK